MSAYPPVRPANGWFRRLARAAALVTATTLTTTGAAGAARADDPTDPIPTRPQVVTITAPTSTVYGKAATVRVQVSAAPVDPAVDPAEPDGLDPALEPVAGAVVTLDEKTTDGWETLRQSATSRSGLATFALALGTGRHVLRATVDADPDAALDAGTSPWARVQVTRAPTALRVPDTITISEHAARVPVTLTSAAGADAVGARWVQFRTRPRHTGTWSRTYARRLDTHGHLTLSVPAWRVTDVQVRFAGTDELLPSTAAATVTARSILPRVVETGRPHPRVQYPTGPAPVGAGANASISPIPESVWRSMVGVSWTSGCPVGRNDLRYVSVNYWGFDGYRYRGHVVVASSIAAGTAGALSELYQRTFRIRSMHPEDVYGPNPLGPGANDYASMAADNTSGFNCRYVVGKEKHKVWSPHAYGIAVDVNPVENPYVAPTGVFPNAWYLTHRSGPGVLTSSSASAFTRRGFFWGGLWAHQDLQHFQRP